MTRFVLVISFLGLLNFSNGQTTDDKQTVVQMSIDLPELQEYYLTEKGDTDNVLIIADNGVVATNLNLTKFGKPVKFMKKKDLFFFGEESYLVFDKFGISRNEADLVFHYPAEGLTILLSFEKVDNKWTIKSRKLTES